MGKFMGVFRLDWIDREWCEEAGVACSPAEARKAVAFGLFLLAGVAVVLTAAVVAVLS